MGGITTEAASLRDPVWIDPNAFNQFSNFSDYKYAQSFYVIDM